MQSQLALLRFDSHNAEILSIPESLFYPSQSRSEFSDLEGSCNFELNEGFYMVETTKGMPSVDKEAHRMAHGVFYDW